MIKEIEEQPAAVGDTIGHYVRDGRIELGDIGLDEKTVKELERIYIIACGSAYHVGMVAKYTIEQMAKIPVDVDLASEFR
jgi:glucosamine--fructose-6-phosphate aminotransferase (isomerizing)